MFFSTSNCFPYVSPYATFPHSAFDSDITASEKVVINSVSLPEEEEVVISSVSPQVIPISYMCIMYTLVALFNFVSFVFFFFTGLPVVHLHTYCPLIFHEINIIRAVTSSKCKAGLRDLHRWKLPKHSISHLTTISSKSTEISSHHSLLRPPEIYLCATLSTNQWRVGSSTDQTLHDSSSFCKSKLPLESPPNGFIKVGSSLFLSTGIPCLDFFSITFVLTESHFTWSIT